MCYLDQPETAIVDPVNGYFESFNDTRVSYHLGQEWSEDRVMPLRAPMWISILNKYGYRIERLSSRVQKILEHAGIDQEDSVDTLEEYIISSVPEPLGDNP